MLSNPHLQIGKRDLALNILMNQVGHIIIVIMSKTDQKSENILLIRNGHIIIVDVLKIDPRLVNI